MAIASDENKLGLAKEGGRAGRWVLCWEVGIGVSVLACSFQQRSSDFLHAGRSRLLTKSSGTVSGWPYTSSAKEQPKVLFWCCPNSQEHPWEVLGPA